jgi:hypothetical protein
MVRTRTAGFIAILSLITLLPASMAGAEVASPAAGPPARDFSLLRGLGLPEIHLVATDAGATGVPTDLAAGRYLVTLDNRTADQNVGIIVLALPAGTTDEDALAGILGEGIPVWFYDAIFAGGRSPIRTRRTPWSWTSRPATGGLPSTAPSRRRSSQLTRRRSCT